MESHGAISSTRSETRTSDLMHLCRWQVNGLKGFGGAWGRGREIGTSLGPPLAKKQRKDKGFRTKQHFS